MQEALVLKSQIREKIGSKSAASLRKQGLIPAVVYGHKEETVAISLDAHDFQNRLRHRSRLLDLQIGNKTQKVIVKDIQYDHIGKNILHIDLMRVDITETINVMVPIELKGTAKGTQEGGIIEGHTNRLEIRCKATDIPETIVVSVKEMEIGDTLHASDIELPQGIELVSDPSTLLVTCSIVAVAKTTEELEAEIPAAPEVIGEVKEPEEEAPQQEAEKKQQPKST